MQQSQYSTPTPLTRDRNQTDRAQRDKNQTDQAKRCILRRQPRSAENREALTGFRRKQRSSNFHEASSLEAKAVKRKFARGENREAQIRKWGKPRSANLQEARAAKCKFASNESREAKIRSRRKPRNANSLEMRDYNCHLNSNQTHRF
jgi:hypothetical protein